MNVKARLSLAVVVLLAIATGVLGAVAVRATRSSLIDQVDERLLAARSRFGPEGGFVAGPDGGDRGVQFREFAEIMYASDGTVVRSEPAGFADAPEALPAIPTVPSGELDAIIGRVVTLPAVGGHGHYRVVTQELGDGGVRIVAAPLGSVDATSSDVFRMVLLTAASVLLAGAATSWWIIRRSLRPIDRMIGTAAAIAAGDLSQRVDHPDGRGELGKLAVALDAMLAQLETAFAAREESAKRLRRFVADASHELRTPVAAIRGYAELYRHGGLDDDEALDRAMRRIEGESSRIGVLVEDLLLLARLDQHQPLARAPVDVSALAADAVADLQAVDPDRPIVLDAPESAVVVGDDARLRQVFANLLANARTHTPPGTAVRVDVVEDDEEVRVAVSDSGPGVAPAERARVFERFFRADPSRSRGSGGTGLGLSIVASVVAAHGGRVEVGEVDGGGARFTVHLPRAREGSA